MINFYCIHLIVIHYLDRDGMTVSSWPQDEQRIQTKITTQIKKTLQENRSLFPNEKATSKLPCNECPKYEGYDYSLLDW